MLLSHYHIQIKERRWRAKKKDQHHRTQVSLRRLLVEQIAHNHASHQYSS
ncbi:unnamed protein product, partial [Rotaria magnacalcarata]